MIDKSKNVRFENVDPVDTRELAGTTLEDVLKAFIVMFAEDIMDGKPLTEVIEDNLLDLGELVADEIYELIDLDFLPVIEE